MPRRLKAARLDFYDPGTGALRSSQSGIKRIEIAEHARDQADDAGFQMKHGFADLDAVCRPGDEVRVFVQTQDDADLVHIWTGTVDSRDTNRNGPNFAELPIKAQDFVYDRLANSYASNVWENMDPGAIVRDMLATHAPEVGTANVEDLGTTLAFFIMRDEALLSGIRRLAEMVGADFRGDKDKGFHFYKSKGKSSGASVDPTKVVRGTFSVSANLDGMGNSILIRGGSRHVQDAINDGPPASYENVTNVTRKKVRVFASKSKVSRVDIYTDPQGATGDLVVRIQADNAAGTAPVAESDLAYDLASKNVKAADMAENGWSSFLLPSHVVPPGGHVWVIVESASSDAQRVGVDGSGTLVYKTHFQVPIIVRREDQASITNYGRRELVPITDTNILEEGDAEIIGNAMVAAHKDPQKVGAYQVSDMAGLGGVAVGQTVSASFPKDGIANGTALVIVSKRHVYDGDGGTYALTHHFADNLRGASAADIIRAAFQRIKKVEDAIWDTGTVALVGSATEPATVVSDFVSATEQDAGTFIVGTAKVGFSTL